MQTILEKALQVSRFTDPGSHPFHLKATAAAAYKSAPEFSAEIEEFWQSPDKYRRTIHSKDFDQTVIVNGLSRFERDSSDYYPEWIHTIVLALSDVIPVHSLEQITRLEMEPGLNVNSADLCDLKYSPAATDGITTVTWTGHLIFNMHSGRLDWISSTGFDVGYKDYQPFHNKSVARSIETFPPVPRGDVITKITELGDLVNPDESIFAVPETTPPDRQIRIVPVPEAEYRKLAVDPPPMNWPSVTRRPNSGSLTTFIVTDRTGAVRECRFIISNNTALADSAVELIKKWHIKPYFVDGEPVQVETTMTFPYEAKLEGDQAKFEAPSFYFKRARDLTNPRTESSKPFHLHATFDGAGPWFGQHGEYDETWNSPNHWRRQISIGKTVFSESRVDDDHYVEQTPPTAVVQHVGTILSADFPGFAFFSPDTDWVMADGRLKGVLVTRVAMARIQDDGKMGYPVAYYFDQAGLLRARAINNGTIVSNLQDPHSTTKPSEAIYYDQFLEFEGKQVPRQIDSTIGGDHVMSVHIDVLEPAGIQPDEFFVLPKIKPKDWVDTGVW